MRVRAGIMVLLALAGAAALALVVVTGPLGGFFAHWSTTPGPAPVPPSATAAPATPTPTQSAVPTSAAPTTPALTRFDPSASQSAVLQLFTSVLKQAVAQAGEPDGKALAAALAAAGFDPAAMQRSADRTSVDLAAPSVSVSVRVGQTCYVGQFVRADRSVATGVTSPISTAACLIGRLAPAT